MSKRVYLYDGKDNAYNGFWDCQESPLEPGVYITPVASTEIEPPTFTELQTCRWNGTAWEVKDKAPIVEFIG
jgi:hypothetical protein